MKIINSFFCGDRYDIECYQRIEHALNKKLEEYPLSAGKNAVLILQERVAEACRMAHIQMKEEAMKAGNGSGGLRKRGAGSNMSQYVGSAGADDEESAATKVFKKQRSDGGKKKGYRK
jgi:ATP-dependent RNA helicase DDX47/RRP3